MSDIGGQDPVIDATLHFSTGGFSFGFYDQFQSGTENEIWIGQDYNGPEAGNDDFAAVPELPSGSWSYPWELWMQNPNGVWRLFIMDNSNPDVEAGGEITGSWRVFIKY